MGYAWDVVRLALAVLSVSLVGCGVDGLALVADTDASVEPDAGHAAPIDAAVRDAGAVLTVRDGGTTTVDAGVTDRDGGLEPVHDAGTPQTSGCGAAPGENDRLRTLSHDGRTREFYVHLPPSYDANVPTAVVFDFHGRVFSAAAEMALTKMKDVADREGFIVVHPEGIGRTWNGGVCCGEASTQNVDDVGFVDAMIDHLAGSVCLDERRVFATGMSNGGFMSHRLGCELSNRIAAIAPVSGVMGLARCAPARPVPVFHFHGDEDNVVSYDGFAGYLSVADSTAGWVSRNMCDSQPSVFFEQDDVRCEAWTGCAEGADVRLCTIDGGGHQWPGGQPIPLLGGTTNTISASQMAWDFFASHPMP